jgi:thioredoxin 1
MVGFSGRRTLVQQHGRLLAAANDVERSVSSTQEHATVDIASQESFDSILSDNASKLVVLMCKAKGCRPCKQFAGKYAKLAEHFSDAVFCEVIGDRNDSTRGMMRSMKIRATPTFVFFRDGEKIHEHSGVNAQKMIDALEQAVREGESGYGEEHLHFVNNILSNDDE